MPFLNFKFVLMIMFLTFGPMALHYTIIKRYQYKTKWIKLVAAIPFLLFLVYAYLQVQAGKQKSKTPLLDEILKGSKKPDHSPELIKAVKTGNLERVKKCIVRGGDIECMDKNYMTPLIWACFDGNLKMIDLLISSDADVNNKTKAGFPFLQITKSPLNPSKDSVAIANLLLKHGANPTAEYSEERLNILSSAMFAGDVELVRLLADKIKDDEFINAHYPLVYAAANDLAILKKIYERFPEINHQDWTGDTALHKASKFKKVENVKWLLLKGADPTIKGYRDQTPIDAARNVKNMKIVELLEEYIKANKG